MDFLSHRSSSASRGKMPSRHYASLSGDDSDDYEKPARTPDSWESNLGLDPENRQLLDQIDKLRRCGVYIGLPQIVVVGDQSTGKSSVVEALTRVPFPRAHGKCTRFTTQIRLCRSDQIDTVISILPEPGTSEEEKKTLGGFKQSFGDDADFGTIFERAMDAIFQSGGNHSFLSKHTLDIKISGPDQPHLTVVDLPGIIHSAHTETTETDKNAILALARTYMDKERTIILPVVSGSEDISKQAILMEAKRFDRNGIRTLGIIINPDKTESKEREKEFINLASNKDSKNKLHLGWHILRNRTHNEIHFTHVERDRTEKDFFENSDWGRMLDPSQLGVEALSKRLSTQLIRHFTAEVFKVEDDIKFKLAECREKLAQLGEDYDTPEEMSAEFARLSTGSLRLIRAAILAHGNLTGEVFFPTHEDGEHYARNIRSRIAKQNAFFAEHMEKWGSSCVIVDDKSSHAGKVPPLKGLCSTLRKKTKTHSEYLKFEVQRLVEENSGKELSMDIDAKLVYRFFQSYSSSWIEFAMQHIQDVHKLCEEFMTELLQYAWPKQIGMRVNYKFIQSGIDTMLKNALYELEHLKTDRLRYVAPYESDFLLRFYQWKESQIAGDRSVQ
jgi:GTPase SAR1 family protein